MHEVGKKRGGGTRHVRDTEGHKETKRDTEREAEADGGYKVLL